MCGTLQSLRLIGTNTLDVLYETYAETTTDVRPLTSHGYNAVLKVLELRHQQDRNGSMGWVTMHGKDSHLVPAGQMVVLDGSVTVTGIMSEKSAVLEHLSISSLPSGLLVKTCLTDVPARAPCKIPVVLTNETDHVIIPQKCIIGEISAFQEVNTQKSSTNIKSNLSFNIDGSPVDAEWKERIVQRFHSMPEVFA